MKIKMLTAMAGRDSAGNSYAVLAGETIELPDDEGKRYVDAGLAEAVGPTRKRGAAEVEVRPASIDREVRG